ncbi:hypothetical protein ATHSA_1239 [Athalassotoga saccharophila]|nr:hypothetical protein ATHSA_1239 [Athalassotoga saccharophila]
MFERIKKIITNYYSKLDNISTILSKQYLNQLSSNPIYKNEGRLELYEYKVY